MIPTEQVQQPVREQQQHFVFDRVPVLAGLPRSRVDREHDIAERIACERGEFTLAQCEGEHVGGTGLRAVPGVERRDLAIATEQHRQLRARDAEVGHHDLRRARDVADQARIATSTSTAGRDRDAHGAGARSLAAAAAAISSGVSLNTQCQIG
jgi:hypothetical protein